MLNNEKHQRIMGQILRDIYTNTALSSLMGFKGGTCAYFFYGLTRFSVDLDFDLFVTDEETQAVVNEIFKKYGNVQITLERVTPEVKRNYTVQKYLGIPMQVGKKEYLFASKLCALTNRNVLAMRDIYDIWFFAKNNWEINEEIIETRTGKTLKEYSEDCVKMIESVKDSEILAGLAELLPGEKEKQWVREHLRKEAIFLLRNYSAVRK